MMKSMRTFIAAAILAGAAPPASAQDADFTPEDAALLSRCVDLARIAVTGVNITAKSDAPAAPPRGANTPQKLEDCIGVAADPCMDSPEGSTTVGMTQCLARETAWWDSQLNARYAELRTTLDVESFAELRGAQRAWIAFRDADCSFRYAYWREGTIRSLFYGSCMLDLTAKRAIDLEDVANWAL